MSQTPKANVLKTAGAGSASALHSQGKQFSEELNEMRERALKRAAQLKGQAGNWLDAHPKERKMLGDAEDKWKTLTHREDSSGAETAHSLSRQDECYGPGRRTVIYGANAAQEAGRAHEELSRGYGRFSR